jgi:hypothetical protein
MVTQFSIVGGADAKRFTLKKGNKLTFKATAFKAQSNTYHVKIKAFQELFDRDFIAALKAVALKVNLLPSSKVTLLASASSNIVKLAPPLLVASVITLSVFSGEKS